MTTKLSQTAGAEAAAKPHNLPDPVKLKHLLGSSFLVLGPPRVMAADYYGPGQTYAIFDVQTVAGDVVTVSTYSSPVQRALLAVESDQWPVWVKAVYGTAKVGTYMTLVDGDGEAPSLTEDAKRLVGVESLAAIAEDPSAPSPPPPAPRRDRATQRTRTALPEQVDGEGIVWTRDTVGALADQVNYPDEKRMAIARVFGPNHEDRWGHIARHIIGWTKAQAEADEIAAGKRTPLLTRVP